MSKFWCPHCKDDITEFVRDETNVKTGGIVVFSGMVGFICGLIGYIIGKF